MESLYVCIQIESFAHSGCWVRSRLMLVADAVKPDLSVVCRGRCVLHPRVVDDVLERRAFCRAEGQATLDKLLTLCKKNKQDV